MKCQNSDLKLKIWKNGRNVEKYTKCQISDLKLEICRNGRNVEKLTETRKYRKIHEMSK
jgi:hypothetical protein